MEERTALERAQVISKVMHINISKDLDDQEVMLSTNKEGTLVTVIPKKERNVVFQYEHLLGREKRLTNK